METKKEEIEAIEVFGGFCTQYSNTPGLHHSIIPKVQYSNIPVFHYSNFLQEVL